MGVYTENKLVIVTEPSTVYFDLPKNVGNNLQHKFDSLIKHGKLLAKEIIKKNNNSQLLSKYKHGSNIHEHGKQ